MSRLYPIFTSLAARKVVIVGGGRVAERKVMDLLECDCRIVVIAPDMTEKLMQVWQAGQIQAESRPYQNGDLKDAALVIAATNDYQTNESIFNEAQQRGIFCNVVDIPELCSFQVPSVLRRGDLQIAISTSGASPALAKRIRKQLEAEFGEHYVTFMAALKKLREHLKKMYPDDQARRAGILKEFVNSEALALLQEGKHKDFEQMLDSLLNH
ncbi:MAG: bifunctional precorrin-2 dehydrogenase/sirohydrochlorin ferrochelatase [Sedimentisphaerales bacterium]|nr:bifunctional precorrin-2 dehydrogenase/sirohydrochlorin ferrochelatase [Sedimentisphaerales bacterium]